MLYWKQFIGGLVNAFTKLDKMPGDRLVFYPAFYVMDFSLLSPLEFFADPKNGDGRNNQPPAMRVCDKSYTKKFSKSATISVFRT